MSAKRRKNYATRDQKELLELLEVRHQVGRSREEAQQVLLRLMSKGGERRPQSNTGVSPSGPCENVVGLLFAIVKGRMRGRRAWELFRFRRRGGCSKVERGEDRPPDPLLPRAKESLLSMHAALVAYHNTIVGTRFTVALLYFAASAFLMTVLGQGWARGVPSVYVALPGVLLSIALWCAEVRNACLLENVTERGRYIEERGLQDAEGWGFFSLMGHQHFAPRYPFVPRQWHCSKVWRDGQKGPIAAYFLSHSIALSFVYVLGLGLWVVAAYVSIAG